MVVLTGEELLPAATPRWSPLQSRLDRSQHYLSSKLSSSPLARVSLRPLSICLSLVSPVAIAIDGQIDRLARRWVPLPKSDDSAAVHTEPENERMCSVPPVSIADPAPTTAAVVQGAEAARMLVGAAWERHMNEELALSGLTPDQCLHAFYNASCHCFVAPSSHSPSTSLPSSSSVSCSALTFISHLRSTLRSAWHPDLLPAAQSFHQLASDHLQLHSLPYPAPSPFSLFFPDSFREHFFALLASSIRAVYERQLFDMSPAVYSSLERVYDSPAPSIALHALQLQLAADPSLSLLLPHVTHVLQRIHHARMKDSFDNSQPCTTLVLSTPIVTQLPLSAAIWSTIDTALLRWRQAVHRGCLALHECVRVMEEESERREPSGNGNECLELDGDDRLLLAADDSSDEDGAAEDKQLVPLLNASTYNTAVDSADTPTSLAAQLQRKALSALKQLTATPASYSTSHRASVPPPSPPLSPSSPALHYHLSHLYACLSSVHHHLLQYLLSAPLVSYPNDLLTLARESALCVLGGEKERLGELEYSGLVGKLYEVLRALVDAVTAVQTAH